MKKILILGGSHAEISLIKAAKENGFYVYTSGNNPDGIGHKYSDEYRKADFSDKDAIYELAIKLGIDAICPCANDFSAITCSYVAGKLGFNNYDSYETSLTIHHKDKFRDFALKNNLSVPKAEGFEDINSIIENISCFELPLIIKPVDLSGGKGIQKIDEENLPRLEFFVKKALSLSKQKIIVLEEFIEGTNHGLSCILIDGRIKFSFIDDEHYFLNKYLVSGASSPSSVPQKIIDDIVLEMERVASILNLKNGILHIQFILNNNKFYIIELCRRPPGDLYIDLVKYVTGIDYPDILIKLFSAGDISGIDLHINDKNLLTRHCIMPRSCGIVKDVFFDPLISKFIFDKLMFFKAGDRVIDALNYKAGIVFIKYNTLDEMKRLLPELDNLIKIELY